jgi:BASS family bile acid:Na+ symporter
MDRCRRGITGLAHFLHRHFLWFLIGSYAVAAVCPAFGLWIRSASLRDLGLGREGTTVTLPMLLLALVLLNAGLGVQTGQLRHLLQRPLALLAGLATNLTVPLGFIFGLGWLLRLWHNPEEVQHLLLGLALVASMPIAGSSAAWSQKSNGDLALSLALVLVSTCLSPVTTPVAFYVVGGLLAEPYARELRGLAGHGTGVFLLSCLLGPSALGILLRYGLGEGRLATAQPFLKLANCVNLLLLNYVNASLSLPQTICNPDWDFLAVTLGVVVRLCVLAFAAGGLVARLLRIDLGQQVALMFGLGMSNNGAGLVLASMAWAAYPRVLLPILFYNLCQHLVAGGVDLVLTRQTCVATPGYRLPPHPTCQGTPKR